VAITTLSCIPSSFEAGVTTIFNHSDTSFPVDEDWESFLILAKPGQPPKRIDGTVDGAKFLFTIPKVVSAGWQAGYYDYAFYFEKDGERGTGVRGKIAILDNLAIAQPKTEAELNVERIHKSIAELAASTERSRNFNGQSSTDAEMSAFQKDLTWWISRVIKERDDLARMRGTQESGYIRVL
jgi:hypothetical protein